MSLTTGNYIMDHILAMLPSNEKAIYLPYSIYHHTGGKKKFITQHYARVFGTKDLSEEELAQFLQPIEDIMTDFQRGVFQPPLWILILSFLLIPLLLYSIYFCCKQCCCGTKPPTILDASVRIQEYLKEKKPWLESKGLSVTFNMGYIAILTIFRGEPFMTNLNHVMYYGGRAAHGGAVPLQMQQTHQMNMQYQQGQNMNTGMYNQNMYNQNMGMNNPGMMAQQNNMNMYGQPGNPSSYQNPPNANFNIA